MSINKAYLDELWGSAHYREVVAKVEKLKPIVPKFDHEAGGTNIETIKFRLAQLEMYEAVIRMLKPDTP